MAKCAPSQISGYPTDPLLKHDRITFLERYIGVTASSFFAFHTILKTSKDYYEAMRWARHLADNITAMINGNQTGSDAINVFPYSVFYVFYEQVTIPKTR